MAIRLSDSTVRDLPSPPSGNRITYDDKTKGFGCRVTAAGTKAFVLNYRTRAGRERRYTIGSYPEWKVSAARTEAEDLKKRIDRGEDPLADIQADRAAPAVADLCARFCEEYLPKKRPSTRRDYQGIINNDILPGLKHLKVVEVTFSDLDGLHRRITKRAPYRANRAAALLSKLFNLAIRWGWRSDNPASGIERNHEEKRQRYLSGAELKRFTDALADFEDKQAADIFRLLLLTGARRGEVQALRWDHLDLDAGVWTKPGATTKQRSVHRVPLSAPALQLLVELRAAADEGSEYVFPGRSGGHRTELKGAWAAVCKAARIKNARIHDLRHTYASLLASSGLSLPIIGALLGHTQPATTHRYAHLLDDPLRAATERVGMVVRGQTGGEVIPLKGERHG